jgi:hypothetical protein
MCIIKCSQKGFLVGFDDKDQPIWGNRCSALLFDDSHAVDLCWELYDGETHSVSTVSVRD